MGAAVPQRCLKVKAACQKEAQDSPQQEGQPLHNQ